jgi:adenylosuccinate lyase
MLNKFCDIVAKLVVHEDRMKENLEKSKGVVFSGKILLELIDRGMSRNDGYDVMQRVAFMSKRDNIDFRDALMSDEQVRSLIGAKELDEMLDIRHYVKNVDKIFRRVGI